MTSCILGYIYVLMKRETVISLLCKTPFTVEYPIYTLFYISIGWTINFFLLVSLLEMLKLVHSMCIWNSFLWQFLSWHLDDKNRIRVRAFMNCPATIVHVILWGVNLFKLWAMLQKLIIMKFLLLVGCNDFTGKSKFVDSR